MKRQKYKELFSILILLIVAILSGNLYASDCSYDDDAYLAGQKAACTEASMEWVCELNRCMTKESAVDTRSRLEACDSLETSAAKKQCVENLAREKSGSPSNSLPSGGKEFLAKTVYGMSVGLVAISYLSKEGSTSCTSKTIMKVAGLGYIASELYNFFFVKDKLKKLREEYDNKAIEDATYNAQVDAFNYLKEEQQIIKDTANRKYMINMGLALAFGAATAVALYEMTWGTPCGASSTEEGNSGGGDGGDGADKEPKPASPKYWDQKLTPANMFTISMLQFFFPKAFADDAKKYTQGSISDYLPVLLGAGGAVALSQMKGKFGEFFNSSKGIAVISGVAAGLSFMLAQEHKKVADEAKDNISKIEEALKEFKADASRFCPDGREDLSVPECYCYNSDGTENDDHSASETCQNLWANDKIEAIATDYSSDTSDLGELGCVTKDEQFDADCDCKKLINTKTGDDACLKVTGSLGSINFASASGVSDTTKQLNDLVSGDLAKGTLGVSSYGKNAARLNRVRDDLLRSYNKGKNTKFNLPNKEQREALLNQIASKKLLDSSQDGALGTSLNQMSSLSKAPKKLEQALKKANTQIAYKKTKSVQKTKKKENGFSFDYSGGSSARSGKALSYGAEKSKYKFSKQDIHGSGQSIWRIITTRYNKSALSKLFDDE